MLTFSKGPLQVSRDLEDSGQKSRPETLPRPGCRQDEGPRGWSRALRPPNGHRGSTFGGKG
jgi:hypothetical protein